MAGIRRRNVPPPALADEHDADVAASNKRQIPLFKRSSGQAGTAADEAKSVLSFQSSQPGELTQSRACCRAVLDEATGRVSLDLPRTPYHELDLSDTFLTALHDAPFEPKKGWGKKRRLWFVFGGLLGLFAGFVHAPCAFP